MTTNSPNINFQGIIKHSNFDKPLITYRTIQFTIIEKQFLQLTNYHHCHKNNISLHQNYTFCPLNYKTYFYANQPQFLNNFMKQNLSIQTIAVFQEANSKYKCTFKNCKNNFWQTLCQLKLIIEIWKWERNFRELLK